MIAFSWRSLVPAVALKFSVWLSGQLVKCAQEIPRYTASIIDNRWQRLGIGHVCFYLPPFSFLRCGCFIPLLRPITPLMHPLYDPRSTSQLYTTRAPNRCSPLMVSDRGMDIVSRDGVVSFLLSPSPSLARPPTAKRRASTGKEGTAEAARGSGRGKKR